MLMMPDEMMRQVVRELAEPRHLQSTLRSGDFLVVIEKGLISP